MTVGDAADSGAAGGRLLVGGHAVVIGGEHGSTVDMAGEPPRPRRRVRSAPHEDLLGRDEDLRAVALAAGPGEPTQVYGPPGVGKSALLHQLARQFAADGQEVVYLYGTGREIDDVLQDMFEACYDSAGYAPSRIQLRHSLQHVMASVLVDDLDCPPDQLRRFLDAAPDATVVFTSIERQLQGGHALELGGLPKEAAFELLARELGRPLQPAEVPAATALWDATAGNPLELLRAAAAAVTGSAGRAQLAVGQSPAGLVPVLFARMTEPQRAVIALFATFPDAPVADHLLAEFTGVGEAAEAARQLARRGLLSRADQGYRLAPGISDRLPAEARLAPAAVEETTVRVAAWADSAAATPADVSGHARLLAALVDAAAGRRPDLAVRLARAVSPAAARSLRWGGWRRILDAGSRAAGKAGDRAAEAYFQHERGIRQLCLGMSAAGATLGAAAVLWKQLGDNSGTAITMHAQNVLASPAGIAAQAAPASSAAATSTSTASAATTSGTAATTTTAASTTTAAASGTGGTAAATTAAAATTKLVVIKTVAVLTGLGAAGAGTTYAVPQIKAAIERRPYSVGCARVSPGLLEFGEVTIGTKGQTKQVTITNTCDQPSRRPKLAIKGAGFAVVKNGCGRRPLAADQSCVITVRYLPSKADDQEGALHLTAGAETADTRLTGAGEVPPLAGVFAFNKFDLECPDNLGAPAANADADVCSIATQAINEALRQLPPVRIKVDPKCAKQPCRYQLIDTPAGKNEKPETALLAPAENDAFTLRSPAIEATAQQVASLVLPGARVENLRLDLRPRDKADGRVTRFEVTSAYTIVDPAGRRLNFTETYGFARAPS